MLTLLLTLLPAFASPPVDVRRVVLVDGQPWLVGVEPAESDGPWVGYPAGYFLRHWVGPTSTLSTGITVGSAWQAGPSACTVDGLAAVASEHTEDAVEGRSEGEPTCGSPVLWGRLRCDQPPSEGFAVPSGRPAVVVASHQGEVERPDLVAKVRDLESWRAHRSLVEQAARELPVEEGVDPVYEIVRVNRYAAGDRSWLVVDAEIGWGGGYSACGGTGGIQRSLSVWTDTKRPRLVSEAWSEEQPHVMGMVVVEGRPWLHMGSEGNEYLGADLRALLYASEVCICLC